MAGYFHSVMLFDDLRARIDGAVFDSTSPDYGTVLASSRAAYDVMDQVPAVGASIDSEFAYVEGAKPRKRSWGG